MLQRIFDLVKKFWLWLLAFEDETRLKPDRTTIENAPPSAITPEKVLEIMEADPPAYRKRRSLCTSSERTFYDTLHEAIGYEYLVCPKVRLGDILWLKEERDSSNHKFFANQIYCKHVDFLLCEKWRLTPVLAIELDDKGHNRFDRRQQDEFKNKAFEIAGCLCCALKCKLAMRRRNCENKFLRNSKLQNKKAPTLLFATAARGRTGPSTLACDLTTFWFLVACRSLLEMKRE